MDEEDKATVLALVHCHILESTDYCSVVHAYRRKLRKVGRSHIPAFKWVSKHSRRRALYRGALCNLKCTCKFETLGVDVCERLIET